MSVPIEDVQTTFAATLVDEWIRGGVTHAVLCPGSRSTPLALALALRRELTVHVRLDERGACFYAIGVALATRGPAIVCTTSGTAAAELHAGVVEASYAGVPLIVCTADRPARLHHVGAAQTIEQDGIFSSALRWAFAPGPIREADRAWWRSLAARSLTEAVRGAGPVHLNLAFEEPLVGTAGPLPPAAPAPPLGAPVLSRSLGNPLSPHRWRRRGIIVAGGDVGPPWAVLALAERLGWPIFADPRTGARVPHPAVVASADALLRDPAVREAAMPETVLLLGRPWASRVVAEFIESAGRSGSDVVAVGASLSDPGRVVREFHPVDVGRFLSDLGPIGGSAPAGWRERFERLEAAAQAAISAGLKRDPLSAGGRTNEPSVARHLFGALETTTTLFVAASMPARDLEWFAAPRAAPPWVLSNRGVNGIDGVCSGALGAAGGASGAVVALLGDLAFFHDLSALVSVGEEHGSCTLVVLDNGGGGIFNFLPQSKALERGRFEQLFATPPRASVLQVASGFGLPVADVSTLGALDDALERFVGREPRAVIRVAVPGREENVELHDRLHGAVAQAARAALAQ